MSHWCKTGLYGCHKHGTMSSNSKLLLATQRTAPAAGLFGLRLADPANPLSVKAGRPGAIADADDRESFAGQFLAGTHARPATRRQS